MPDYATLNRATASYSGRWGKRGKFQTFRMWLPTNAAGGGNVSGYSAPPWRVVAFKHGGAKMNPQALDLDTNSSALYFANTLGCVVVSYDTTPGGFYEPTAQEPDSKHWPETHEEDAAFIAWLRSNWNNTALFGAGGSISVLSSKWLHWGLSSGGWDVIKTQLARDGEFDYASGAVQRGDARFLAKYGHTCDFVWVNQTQAILSTFVKSKLASPAPSSYTVNGAHSIGATTLAITGGTGAWVKGNRLSITGDSLQYAVSADKASGAGNLSIFPALRVALSGGEAIAQELTNVEKYGDYAWCGGYFFRQGQGIIWQSDTVSGATGLEFPWDIKRQADADVQCTADNPRVKEVAWLFLGATGGGELLTTALTGELSFRNILPGTYGLAADGTIHPAFSSLHSEAQAFALAYVLDQLGNTSNVEVYAGNATTNVNVGETNWNKGRASAFNTTVLGTFLSSRNF